MILCSLLNLLQGWVGGLVGRSAGGSVSSEEPLHGFLLPEDRPGSPPPFLDLAHSKPQQLSTFALTLYKHTATVDGKTVLVGKGLVDAVVEATARSPVPGLIGWDPVLMNTPVRGLEVPH